MQKSQEISLFNGRINQKIDSNRVILPSDSFFIQSIKHQTNKKPSNRLIRAKIKSVIIIAVTLSVLCMIGLIIAAFYEDLTQKTNEDYEITDIENTKVSKNIDEAVIARQKNSLKSFQFDLKEYKKHLDNSTLDSIVVLPKYEKFNYNLAHYLLKSKNITQLFCLNCSEETLQRIRLKRFYQLMDIDNKQFESGEYWVHQYNTPYFQSLSEVKELIQLIKDYSTKMLTGFSLFWQNTTLYNNTDQNLKDQLHEQIKLMGFYYIQPVSLNLRFMEKGIIMIFQRKAPKYQPIPFQASPKVIGFQSVFRMTENLPFLREWLAYHVNIGISRFFFYDNEGTIRDDAGQSSANNTKYGVKLSCIGLTEEKKIAMFDQIWQDFQGYIIYIPWQPLKKGQIVYKQKKATHNYLAYFRDVTKWTLYTDIDEFIFSPQDLNLIDFTLGKEKDGSTQLILKHFKQQSRFCTDEKLVIQSFLGLKIDGVNWAPKMIVLNNAAKKYEVHLMQTTFGKKQSINENEFRFYHYNLNEYLIKWGSQNLLNKAKNTHIDDSMKRYVPVIKEYCKDKCGNSFKMACPIEKRHTSTKCATLKDYS